MYRGRLRLYVRILRVEDENYDWVLITEDDVEEGSLEKKKGIIRFLYEKKTGIARPQVIPQMRLESSLGLNSKLAWSGTILYSIGGKEKIHSPLNGGSTRVMLFNTSAASSSSHLAKMDWSECRPFMPMVLNDLVTTMVDNELFVLGVDECGICHVHMLNLQSPSPSHGSWSEVEVLKEMRGLYPHYCFLWEHEVGGERMRWLVVLFCRSRQVADDWFSNSVRQFFYFDIKTREWAFLAETRCKDFGLVLYSLLVHDGEDTLFNIGRAKEWFAYELANKCVKGKVMGWEALEELMGCAIDGFNCWIAGGCSLGNREFLLLWNTSGGGLMCYLSKVKISDDLVAKVQSFRQLCIGKDCWIESCVPICVPQQQSTALTIDTPLLGETRESNQDGGRSIPFRAFNLAVAMLLICTFIRENAVHLV